jgi:RimJ/RimL family protein N-acetyltransferase
VMEDNARMRRILEALGFTRTKLHRVFQGSIDSRAAGRVSGGGTPR